MKRAELANVPSVDLRPLVSQTFHQPEGETPSNQFQDLMVNGATQKYAAIDRLPWEYGKMFKEQKLSETGYEYKMPRVPVSVVDLHAPSRHKLLVRYCSDCVGLMTLAHDWNEAVEEGLRANVDKLQAHGLRQLVRSLTDTTAAQAKEIIELRRDIALKEPSESFIDKRMRQEHDSYIIHEQSEKLKKWRAIAEMCDAERETVEGNIRHNFNLKLNRLREEYDALLDQLNEKREECSFLEARVDKMMQVFSQHEQRVMEHQNEVTQLNYRLTQQAMELQRCERSREEVIKGINGKDNYILEQKEEFLERIDSLNEKISVKTMENEQLTSQIDQLKSELSEVTLDAMQAKARYAVDNNEAVEARLSLSRAADAQLMRFEDLRSAWHRDYARTAAVSRILPCDSESDEDSIASMISDNDNKKAEIKRSLMLFPTKMRNNIAIAIEEVVSLNKTQRRFSSAGSVSGRSAGGSRRGSSSNVLSRRSSRKDLPVVVPAVIAEDDIGDDLSSVGNDVSDDEQSMRHSPRSSQLLADSVSRMKPRKPSVATFSGPDILILQDMLPSVGNAEVGVGSALPAFLDDPSEARVASSAADSTGGDLSAAALNDAESSIRAPDDDQISETESEALRRESALLDSIKDGMNQLVETVLPQLSRDQLYDCPHRLKVVAIAVRFLLRLRRGLAERRYSILGSYGLRLHVKSLQKQDERNAKPASEELTALTNALSSAEVTIRDLRVSIAAEIKERKKAVTKGVELEKLVEKLEDAAVISKTNLIRERMISRLQRTNAEYLATHMSVFRARLHLMTHVNQIQEVVPPDMVPPPNKKAPPQTSSAKKRGTVRMSFGSRAYSQEQKARAAAVLSDEEEENDVSRSPLYKVRKVFYHVLARLRRLKFDRPFRRANSMLLTAQHGKAISAWMVREESILVAFVRDATVELTEVESILKRMRHQCSEDRRKAEGFRALLGVDTPLSVGMSYVGEPPVNAGSTGLRQLKTGPVKEDHAIISPLSDVSDLKTAEFVGVDRNALRVLASFRHRDLKPELDFLKSKTHISGGSTAQSRPRSLTTRAQSTALETTIEETSLELKVTAAKPQLSHAHSMGSSEAIVTTPFQMTEQQREVKATLRQKLRRNAVSGPAGVKPDDHHNQEMKYKFELEKAAANDARLERKIERLTARVEVMEEELSAGYSEQSRLQAELDLLIEDHEFLRKQNNALKLAVSDSYRVCYEKTTEEIQKLGLDKLHFQQEHMRDVCTQVACVPCDLAVHDATVGAHVHRNPRLRSAVPQGGGVEGRNVMPDEDNVIGPFNDAQEAYVTQKSELAAAIKPVHGSPERALLETAWSGGRQKRQPSRAGEDAEAEFKHTWGDLMHTYNQRTNRSPPKPRAMIKARPLSAVQLTTPKAVTSDTTDNLHEVIQELRGLGTLQMDETSLEVLTAGSRKGMHHATHNYATDINTHGVHISAAGQYLQYLSAPNERPVVKVRGSAQNQPSTFSKIRSFPRQRTQSSQSMSSQQLATHA